MSEFMNQYRREQRLTWEEFSHRYGDIHYFNFSWRGCHEYPNGVISFIDGGEIVVA